MWVCGLAVDGACGVIRIPERIKTIEYLAFYNCKQLQKVSNTSKLTTIGGEAFNCCMALKEVMFPKTLTEIGELAESQLLQLQTAQTAHGHHRWAPPLGTPAQRRCANTLLLVEARLYSLWSTSSSSGLDALALGASSSPSPDEPLPALPDELWVLVLGWLRRSELGAPVCA